MMKIESFLLSEKGWVPNNSRLPVVFYRGALVGDANGLADQFEALFEGHGGSPDWRDSVFDYHHYHSIAYEALGFFAGEATL
ncbi:hypothetical protein [Novosphingobium sp. PhB57]|uniref:hypothetical protein n=1 Tax=Novosphingobium sp. PhB57 TaxID=2485107 RepID=UPI001A9F7CC2|nr:hypothetical protein [Novosphingobium sp. PhB57]